MKRFIAIISFLIYSNCAVTQSLFGYPIYDYLMSAVHPYGCDPNYVTGMPDDSIWVNFSDHDTMTGNFRMRWVDSPAEDLLLETGYNTSNYYVRLLLTTGFYSVSHHVLVGDWTQITDTSWHFVETNCIPLMQAHRRYILLLDFQAHFGLTAADTITGIEIVFLNSGGVPDLAGAYIIQEPSPCDTVHLGPDTSLCNGENLLLNATKLNSTYLWQDNSTNPTFNVTLPGTYWVKVTEPICTSSDTIVISNLPVPMVTNNPMSNAICTGESTNIMLTSNVPGTNFHWTSSLTSGNITGFSADSGIVINQTLVNQLVTSGIVTYHITPKVGSCSGIQVDFLVTVNPEDSAKVSIVASVNNICTGTSVTFTATPVNGGTTPVYLWKVNGINVGTNSPNFSYIPQTGDSIRCIMTSNLACVSNNPASSNKIVMVASSIPVVTFTICFDSITRINAKPIKLKGGIPLGGTYSGPGVNSATGVFTPSSAGIGTKIITYSYTNVALCSASKTKTIIVQSAPAFTCGNNLTDIRDGKVYPTIQFGSQCWMAANLNYGKEIPPSQHQRDNCISEKYFNPGSSIQHPASVYQWDEMMQYNDTPGLQGLCPPGWHVPTEAEWNTLFANWTNNAFAGAPLKYSGYSGFNALLSGVRHLNVQWDYQNIATFFWSSTPYGAYKAWAHGMNDYDPSVAAYPSSRANAFSVRCTKD